MTKTISIARDFSSTPGSRWRNEGKHSGQEFREEVLAPALRDAVASGDEILIDLDGVEGFASSFLEESFGGLARESPDLDILSILRFKSNEDPYRIAEIRGYIEEARKRAGAVPS